MFCNQCEQTAKGTGCSVIGVCGKNEEVADLQDLLVYALQGLALYAQEGRRLGIVDDATDRFTYEAIFSTLTNVDFDPARFVAMIERCDALKARLKEKVKAVDELVHEKPYYAMGGGILAGLLLGWLVMRK